MADLEAKRARNREWMRAYYATPEGKAANRLSKQKRYATPEGRAARQVARQRWKKSEKGKARAREYAKKKYVPHPLPRKPELTVEEKRARERAYYRKNHERRKAMQRANATHLKRYGLTKEDYSAMLEAQGHCCAICGGRAGFHKRDRLLCVDHDHGTGKVRGLLCDNCNKGIGNLKEDQSIIFKAILYLRRAQGG